MSNLDASMQALLANIFVGLAVLYLIYRAYLKAKNKEHSSCGGCAGCGKSERHEAQNKPRPAPQATPLITLERPKTSPSPPQKSDYT
jgi:hypothetical protein